MREVPVSLCATRWGGLPGVDLQLLGDIWHSSRVVKKGSVVSILRVLTKRGGDDEKTGGVSTEIR